VPVWIGDGERHGEQIVSTDPGDPERVIATAASASADEAAEAVATATRGFARWSATPAEKRAEILVRAAAWMRERRGELAALEVRECAKPWARPTPTSARPSTSWSTTRAAPSP
jgi:RHH-type proline utilization regulon transcriptional repressor/proline dehydrogenase/delta 1-pyrroline-5-carboxylate dehydrogenase